MNDFDNDIFDAELSDSNAENSHPNGSGADSDSTVVDFKPNLSLLQGCQAVRRKSSEVNNNPIPVKKRRSEIQYESESSDDSDHVQNTDGSEGDSLDDFICPDSVVEYVSSTEDGDSDETISDVDLPDLDPNRQRRTRYSQKVKRPRVETDHTDAYSSSTEPSSSTQSSDVSSIADLNKCSVILKRLVIKSESVDDIIGYNDSKAPKGL